MMHTFARIIETPTTQVLFFMDYDSNEDATNVHQMFYQDDARADICLSFRGDNQEDLAAEYLRRVDQKLAQHLVDSIRQFLVE